MDMAQVNILITLSIDRQFLSPSRHFWPLTVLSTSQVGYIKCVNAFSPSLCKQCGHDIVLLNSVSPFGSTIFIHYAIAFGITFCKHSLPLFVTLAYVPLLKHYSMPSWYSWLGIFTGFNGKHHRPRLIMSSISSRGHTTSIHVEIRTILMTEKC